jgi:hypothetical protein
VTIKIGADGSGMEMIRRGTDVVEVDENASDEVRDKVRARMAHVTVTDSWMRYRLPIIARNLRMNLPKLDAAKCLPMRRLIGRTAIIVSAGTSIDGQREELAALQDRDDLAIYVTNSASRTVKGHVRVCMESLPAMIAVDGDVPLAVDATVDHSIFMRPEVDHVFFKAEGAYSKIAERFGTQVLAFGTSVTTAAVAMAARNGARRIILVGSDLVYDAATKDCYTAASPLAVMKIEIDEEREVARYVNVPEGIHRPDIEVQRMGESSLWTTYDFIGIAEWLEGFAAAHPEIECCNATTRGMSLEGWTPCYLRDAVTDVPRLPDAPEPFPAISDAGTMADLTACRRWEMLRPEVQLYTTSPKMDQSMEGLADDVIRRTVDMYRAAAKAIDGA